MYTQTAAYEDWRVDAKRRTAIMGHGGSKIGVFGDIEGGGQAVAGSNLRGRAHLRWNPYELRPNDSFRLTVTLIGEERTKVAYQKSVPEGYGTNEAWEKQEGASSHFCAMRRKSPFVFGTLQVRHAIVEWAPCLEPRDSVDVRQTQRAHARPPRT